VSQREPQIVHKDFTKNHVGCYAEGSLGFKHIINTMADLIEDYDKELADNIRTIVEWPITDCALIEEVWLVNAEHLLKLHTEDWLTWNLDRRGLFLVEKSK